MLIAAHKLDLRIIIRHIAVIALLTAGALAAWPASGFAADDEASQKMWRGTWSNRKYNTTGPLTCTAVRRDDTTAEARFEGTFMGDPFGYTVSVNTKRERDRTVVEGTAQLDGDKYEWSGYVRGKAFYGQYRSLKGNNGEFRLEETAK